MDKKEIISFPHLASYSTPIAYLLKKLTPHEVMAPPQITKKTLEIGSKYAPDSVCIPFKYNLGNYIEALDNGATILIQAGGGCRYGNYAEVQEKILKDLGYDFKFYSLVDTDRFKASYMFKVFRQLNPKLSFFRFVRYSLLTLLMVIFMDELDKIIRKNIGFEKEKGTFKRVREEMLKELEETRGYIHLFKIYKKYKNKFKKIEIQKNSNCLKIGIIGELYTAMEPFSTFFLEEELARNNIEIKRFTNATYLLFVKGLVAKRYLKKVKKYCHYKIGADGMDNVYRSLYLIDNGYDGIIHTKPFGCTPEITAIPIIDKICKEHSMPIIYFSFDQETSEVGVKTRLEAFYDMLQAKKEEK